MAGPTVSPPTLPALESNYQRFRALITGLSESQLNLPATPPNPENDSPGLSILDLVERVSGHEGNHARQVVETRKFVDAFSSAERAITVAGLGTGNTAEVPMQTRELLANADYVVGSDQALCDGTALDTRRRTPGYAPTTVTS